jgi:hypothetical protein
LHLLLIFVSQDYDGPRLQLGAIVQQAFGHQQQIPFVTLYRPKWPTTTATSSNITAALANLAAGIVVGKLGTATVSPCELLREDDQSLLVARHELKGLASRLRGEGRRVVTVNGSFDVLHAGHLRT